MATEHMTIAAECVAAVDTAVGLDDYQRGLCTLLARQIVRRFEREDAFRQRTFRIFERVNPWQ